MSIKLDDVKSLIDELKVDLVNELSSVRSEIQINASIIKKFDSKFTAIFKKIDVIKNSTESAVKTAEEALKTAKFNEEAIVNINQELTQLSSKHDKAELRSNELEKINSSQSVKIQVLEKRLEDQVNRSSLKSVVVRGLKKLPNESWEDTRLIFAK